jgi:hypothetical protein
MCLNRTLLILLALSLSVVAHGQRTNVTKSRYHYSTPSVKGKKAKTICPVFTPSRYPFHGLGVKIGDPFAVTYKFYARKNLAVAVDFGKAASGLYREYFQEKFGSYVMTDTFPSEDSRISYVAHKAISDYVTEVKILYQIDASRISDGLQFYGGLGWEWKKTELKYDYEYNTDTGPARSDPFGSFRRTRVTMGPQITAGIEYSYFTIPVAAFMEIEYFMDVQGDPGWRKLQGGVGLRYIFGVN